MWFKNDSLKRFVMGESVIWAGDGLSNTASFHFSLSAYGRAPTDMTSVWLSPSSWKRELEFKLSSHWEEALAKAFSEPAPHPPRVVPIFAGPFSTLMSNSLTLTPLDLPSSYAEATHSCLWYCYLGEYMFYRLWNSGEWALNLFLGYNLKGHGCLKQPKHPKQNNMPT